MHEPKNDASANIKDPNLFISLIPVAVVIALLILSLTKYPMDMHIPLIMASVVAALIAVYGLHHKWKDIEKGIFESITSAMQAILITCIIGLIIGSWIMGGIVPSLIYYGLMIISPKFFLLTCLLICSIVSISTGSSWTTAGTIGIAMIGIGTGMGIPAPVTAGCVISGAYFGDKMSPFSDTTNLAPAMAGTTLFAHIRHMIYTTGVSYVICIILYMIVNLHYVSSDIYHGEIDSIMNVLRENFYISPILLIPPVVIIIMIVFRIPAIPGLILSVFLGLLCATVFQHADIGSIADVLEYGFVSETGNATVDSLMTNGGMQNMMWTVSLILCSLTFGGIMYSSGMIGTIAKTILKAAKNDRGLICATLITAICVNMTCGEQYLSILITGKLYRAEYRKRGLAPQNLSRALEDSGTLTSPLIPWTTCAVAMAGYLKVPTLAYLPFCFLGFINLGVSLLYGFTGFTIKRLDEVPADEVLD